MTFSFKKFKLVARGISPVRAMAMALAFLFLTAPVPAGARTSDPPRAAEFRKFIADMWPLAESKGISRKTFDAAFRNVTFDASLIKYTTS